MYFKFFGVLMTWRLLEGDVSTCLEGAGTSADIKADFKRRGSMLVRSKS